MLSSDGIIQGKLFKRSVPVNTNLILRLLMEADTVSLGFLSRASGQSEDAVINKIDSLRRDGHSIERSGGAFRLLPPADAVWPSCIRKTLSTRWAGSLIEYHPVIDSTNFRARALGLEGAPHGTLVIADQQTAGRGRMDRSWETKPGDAILMSLLIRPESLPAVDATGIVLVAALAAAKACSEEGADVRIKWPNDLIVNGKKLCGMLLDMKLSANLVDYAIIGVGININSFPYAENLQHAACLKDACGHPVSRAQVTARFLSRFETLYDRWRSEGIDVILSMYREWSITLGRRVRVIGLNETFEAQAVDILPDGTLRVMTDDNKLRSVHAGDVSVRGVMDYV